mmetsp:Transcript_36574/g.108694  ORF Transcript_36574/g.108694 Transcript_36574/m.108694 type:complete len:203 (+) Transcript_36574:367-975(+)
MYRVQRFPHQTESPASSYQSVKVCGRPPASFFTHDHEVSPVAQTWYVSPCSPRQFPSRPSHQDQDPQDSLPLVCFGDSEPEEFPLMDLRLALLGEGERAVLQLLPSETETCFLASSSARKKRSSMLGPAGASVSSATDDLTSSPATRSSAARTVAASSFPDAAAAAERHSQWSVRALGECPMLTERPAEEESFFRRTPSVAA